MIAFLLVTREVIHGVSGRAYLARGHEAIGSKVIVTFIDLVSLQNPDLVFTPNKL